MLLLIGVSGFCAAQENSLSAVGSSGGWEVILEVMQFLQVIWMLPAIVAWQLMTNQLVFWAAFGLDTYLWVFWSYMKNIAMFVIGFLFLFFIFKSFFQQEPFSILKKQIPKLFLSSILVSMSWFLMRVLVDISVVLTAAVWWLGMEMMNDWLKVQDMEIGINEMQQCYATELSDATDVTFAIGDKSFSTKCTATMDDYLATANSMSGPLMFFGNGVLKISNFNIPDGTVSDWKDIALIVWVQIIIIALFIIPMILLIMVNAFRIFWIWLFIIFSPFIVLINVLDSSKATWKMENFKFSTVIWLIFQPVVIIAGMTLVMVLIAHMSNIVFYGQKTESVNKMFNLEKEYEVFVLDWSLFDGVLSMVWWTIWYLMLTFFTIFLMWAILRAAFSTSSITGKFASESFTFIQNAAMAAPIFWWKFWLSALWQAKEAVKSGTSDTRISERWQKLSSDIQRTLGFKTWDSHAYNSSGLFWASWLSRTAWSQVRREATASYLNLLRNEVAGSTESWSSVLSSNFTFREVWQDFFKAQHKDFYKKIGVTDDEFITNLQNTSSWDEFMKLMSGSVWSENLLKFIDYALTTNKDFTKADFEKFTLTDILTNNPHTWSQIMNNDYSIKK